MVRSWSSHDKALDGRPPFSLADLHGPLKPALYFLNWLAVGIAFLWMVAAMLRAAYRRWHPRQATAGIRSVLPPADGHPLGSPLIPEATS
jgi:hypothetical protein